MRDSGFSLLELLVAASIAALLFGLGLGSYRGQMLRVGREEARMALRHAALLQEEHRLLTGAYAGSVKELGVERPWRSSGGSYTLHLNEGPPSCAADDGVWRCFTLSAKARRDADEDCRLLYLNHQGDAGARDDRNRESDDRCW